MPCSGGERNSECFCCSGDWIGGCLAVVVSVNGECAVMNGVANASLQL